MISDKYQGEYDSNNNIWVFPTITMPKKNSDKLMHTIFYVGLANSVVEKDLLIRYMNKKKANKPNPTYNPKFSFTNFAIPLNEDYLDNNPIPGVVAFYATSTTHEGGDPSYKNITFVLKGKNLGKKNRTNVLTQALSDVQGKYNKKNTKAINKEMNVVTPMLATGEGISGNDAAIKECINSHLSTSAISGVYCQPKYDGVRVMMTLNPNHYSNNVVLPFESDDAVVCYSRECKPLQISEHLLVELEIILKDFMERTNAKSLVFDGEYYNHGIAFQQINGFARGEAESSLKDTINIYVYDYYDGTHSNYELRYTILEDNRDLFDYENSASSILCDVDAEMGHILLSETNKFSDTDSILKYYKDTIGAGYEGIMLRIPSGEYEFSRSNNLIKIKPLLSYEYECIGYKFGKGKDADIPVIECVVGETGVNYAVEWWQTKNGYANIDRNNYKNGKFFAKLKGLTEDEQRKLGREFIVIEANGKTRFENRYLGKKVTIEFLDFSKEMRPEKANCKSFT